MQAQSTRDIIHAISPYGQTEAGEQTAEQKDAIIRSKSLFIDMMAYQIRTLSNAIIGFSDLLRQESLSEPQQEYVQEIYTSGQGLVALVNDVLDLSRMENGQLEVERAECPIRWLLDEVNRLTRTSAEAKGLEFEIDVQGDLPKNIQTDPDRLRQCLINLAGNAVRFTSTGSVRIEVCAEECEGQAYVRFDVIDTGVGIPADKLEEIFQPYSGADEANESILASMNLGLAVSSGLAVANQLVRLLKGHIAVISEVGVGSIFTLVVPAGVNLSSEPAMERYDESKAAPEGERDACTGRVLVVEDQPSNQTVISLLLETMGLEVVVAEDGLSAVEIAGRDTFDVVLMDLNMPRMNGYEATSELRRMGLTTPILALSAAGAPRRDSGFDGFIAKPVDSKGLQQALRKYLPVLERTSAGTAAGDDDHVVIEVTGERQNGRRYQMDES